MAELLDELIGALAVTVEERHREALAGRVAGQVRPHDGKTQNAEVAKLAHLIVLR